MLVGNTFLLIAVTSLAFASSLDGRRRKQTNRTVAAPAAQLHFTATASQVNRTVITEIPSPDSDYVIIETTSERIDSFDEDSDEDIDLDGQRCIIPQRNCVCVARYQCHDESVINTDGTGLIDERRRHVKTLCDEDQVCCSLSAKEESESDELRERASDQKFKKPKCGLRNSCGIDRRLLKPDTAGEADFGEWPWQAMVLTFLEDEDGKYLYNCGASLIDQKWILTAAHCIHKLSEKQLSELHVRLGDWDIKDDKEFLKHVDFEVKQVHIHPKFNPRTLKNDIALLELDDEVEYKPHISPVCIPSETLVIDSKFWSAKCVVTGWGKSPDKLSTYSRTLKELSLPLIENNKCQNLLRKTRLGKRFTLDRGFICAGGQQDVDACEGDGGSPLVCHIGNSWFLTGLVSWGIGCGQENVPGVYVNVAHYNSWIHSVTKNEKEDDDDD